jgi:flavodoxin
MFKHEGKYQIAVFLVLIMLGIWTAIFVPFFGLHSFMAISIAAIGFGFLFYAKLSEKKRTKKLVGWGTSQMTIREKTSYFLGYFMISSYLVFSVYLSLYPSVEITAR